MEHKSLMRWILSAFGLILALVCIGGGIFVALHFGTLPVIEYRDTLTWRKTAGTVVNLSLEHSVDCYVTYKYKVNGVNYEGNHTRTIGHHFHYEDHGHAELCRHLNHTRGIGAISVWYDPDHPKRSALKKTFVGDFWLSMHAFESLALVALGGALIYWVTHWMGIAFALPGADAALLALTIVPVSIVRLVNGYLVAFLPLVCGLLFTVLAVACALQIDFIRTCFSLPARAKIKVPDIWWMTEEDDVTPQQQQGTGSNSSGDRSVNANNV